MPEGMPVKCPQCGHENTDRTSRCVKCDHMIRSDIISVRTREVSGSIVKYYFYVSVLGMLVIFLATILANFGILFADNPAAKMPTVFLWGMFVAAMAVIISSLKGFSREIHRDKKNKLFFRYGNLINVLLFIYIVVLLYFTIS